MLGPFAQLSCSSPEPAPQDDPVDANNKDKFILLGIRQTILDRTLEMMKESQEFKSGESDTFNIIYIDNTPVSVSLDLENAYASDEYPDKRQITYLPIKDFQIPAEGEKSSFGFIHYFDDTKLSIFLQVVVYLPPEENRFNTPEDNSSTTPTYSEYEVTYSSSKHEQYGLARSRILQKSDIADEEAFRKFELSDRTVLLGTNSRDENKFLFVILKIPSWEDKLLQLYHRWY